MDTGDNSVSLSGMLSILRRRKFYLLVPIVLLTAGAAIVAKKLPQRFRAKTLVAATPLTPANYLTGRPDTAATINVQEQLRSIRETLLSAPVLSAVRREFKVSGDDRGRTPDQAADDLRSRVQIQVEGPDAFYLGFEGPDRQQVTQIANRLAELFIERNASLHGEKVEEADQFLDREVARLRQQLNAQEEGLKAYKQSVAQELPERLQTNLRLLENLKQQIQSETDHLNESQARRSAVMDELKTLEKQGALEPQPPQKTPAETALEDARFKLAQLKARYTPEHPAIAQAETEVRELEAGARSAVRVHPEPSPLRMRYDSLQAELKSLDGQLRSYAGEREALAAELSHEEEKINAAPGYETELNQRMRDTALARSQYETLFAKQQEAKLNQRAEKASNQVSFKIIEPAQLPAAPYSPQRIRIILLGLLAGVVGGIGAMLLREHLDTSFVTVEELQKFVNLPVLAGIPAISNRRARIQRPRKATAGGLTLMKAGAQGVSVSDMQHLGKNRIVVVSDPASVPAEQYRILTLKIQRWMTQSGGQILAITSAGGGEGKSVTALNVSFALSALMPGRVVLIDCDSRRPRVHEYLGMKLTPGFSNLLLDSEAEISSSISKIRTLDIVPGGTLFSDLGALLASQRARDVIASLRKQYRIIVLDSPPIVPTADSHVLAGTADGVVVVVRARRTKRELLKRSIESLGGGNLLGTVLNDVNYGDSCYAYAYHYYQKQYLGTR